MIERLGQGRHVVRGLVLEVSGGPAVQIPGGSRQAAQRSLPDQVVREPDSSAVGSDEESGSLEFSDR